MQPHKARYLSSCRKPRPHDSNPRSPLSQAPPNRSWFSKFTHALVTIWDKLVGNNESELVESEGENWQNLKFGPELKVTCPEVDETSFREEFHSRVQQQLPSVFQPQSAKPSFPALDPLFTTPHLCCAATTKGSDATLSSLGTLCSGNHQQQSQQQQPLSSRITTGPLSGRPEPLARVGQKPHPQPVGYGLEPRVSRKIFRAEPEPLQNQNVRKKQLHIENSEDELMVDINNPKDELKENQLKKNIEAIKQEIFDKKAEAERVAPSRTGGPATKLRAAPSKKPLGKKQLNPPVEPISEAEKEKKLLRKVEEFLDKKLDDIGERTSVKLVEMMQQKMGTLKNESRDPSSPSQQQPQPISQLPVSEPQPAATAPVAVATQKPKPVLVVAEQKAITIEPWKPRKAEYKETAVQLSPMFSQVPKRFIEFSASSATVPPPTQPQPGVPVMQPQQPVTKPEFPPVLLTKPPPPASDQAKHLEPEKVAPAAALVAVQQKLPEEDKKAGEPVKSEPSVSNHATLPVAQVPAPSAAAVSVSPLLVAAAPAEPQSQEDSKQASTSSVRKSMPSIKKSSAVTAAVVTSAPSSAPQIPLVSAPVAPSAPAATPVAPPSEVPAKPAVAEALPAHYLAPSAENPAPAPVAAPAMAAAPDPKSENVFPQPAPLTFPAKPPVLASNNPFLNPPAPKKDGAVLFGAAFGGTGGAVTTAAPVFGPAPQPMPVPIRPSEPVHFGWAPQPKPAFDSGRSFYPGVSVPQTMNTNEIEMTDSQTAAARAPFPAFSTAAPATFPVAPAMAPTVAPNPFQQQPMGGSQGTFPPSAQPQSNWNKDLFGFGPGKKKNDEDNLFDTGPKRTLYRVVKRG